ncbi:MAG: hypothetical protein ACJ781_18550 [Myxococcales bacterium]
MRSQRRPLYIALSILAVGWGIGIPVCLVSAAEDALPFEMTTEDRRYVYQLERFGGKSAVLYSELYDAFSSLWHGPRLGITIGVLSCLVALVYYWSATGKRSHPRRRS